MAMHVANAAIELVVIVDAPLTTAVGGSVGARVGEAVIPDTVTVAVAVPEKAIPSVAIEATRLLAKLPSVLALETEDDAAFASAAVRPAMEDVTISPAESRRCLKLLRAWPATSLREPAAVVGAAVGAAVGA